MDPIDEAILRELTLDARIPYHALGERVGLSPNAAANRVRRLVDNGTIRRFTISTGPAPTVPAGLEVFIEVRMKEGTTNEAFTDALARAFPEVLDAVHVTGSYDYLIHAVVADPSALDQFVRRLKRDANAGQTFTRLALRS